jgi:hypothetical protein
VDILNDTALIVAFIGKPLLPCELLVVTIIFVQKVWFESGWKVYWNSSGDRILGVAVDEYGSDASPPNLLDSYTRLSSVSFFSCRASFHPSHMDRGKSAVTSSALWVLPFLT